ncbi:MAG: DUF1489 domain-containing protein [Sphingobium sp.]|nr:DUF1489 domain-containing protein [Sphingobium sp.]MBP6110941.1 DUF1489 domain-containing protein [Sphingobium sp.]MBP8670639.1 DUF1489 domain-containing protein [Sphingobium sp.]MBP9156987.1 DUF1489 domain-containing protein [Sphingobium sp.]MCC6482201.1 DUF1489 domain-containing protein [Sphingomonadaceae bacterium]
MPLHLTKIAFGCDSVADLTARLQRRAEEEHGEAHLTTRYAPKRMDELVGGSLYWIHGGLIVGRSPLIGFEDNKAGRYWLKIEPRLIPVVPAPKRAHQGWRYLEEKDAPRDLGDGELAGDSLPAMMAAELGRLGLV